MASAIPDPQPGQVENRIAELNRVLSAGISDIPPEKREEIFSELRKLGLILPLARRLAEIEKTTRELEKIALEESDRALAEMASEELTSLAAEKELIENSIREASHDPDPLDTRNAIVEIRAGTGGEEASMFARDLFRMYSRYAENKGMKLEVFDSHFSAQNGIRFITFMLSRKGAYGLLKFESGVHRVQRVPVTESSGRLHTSAATVAVFPETPDRDVKIDPRDLRIDTFCAGGHGGQSVNTTYSAVRITHLPSGLVVSCQDERSQFQNKQRALKVLAARLAEQEREKEAASQSAERKNRIRSGDRSEKIRTYNFSQNRVTDHRCDFTSHNLRSIMDGELDEMISSLTLSEQKQE